MTGKNGGGTGSDALTLCVGSGIDMGADGTCADAIDCATATPSFADLVDQTVTFTFQNTSYEFQSSTTYYMVLRSADTINGVWYENTAGYANGEAFWTNASDCDLTGHQDRGKDYKFAVYTCSD